MKWISVEDELPKDETPVIVWFRGREQRIAELGWEYPSYEETWNKYEYWDCPYNDGQDWGWDDITHWMPLPDPPKEDK